MSSPDRLRMGLAAAALAVLAALWAMACGGSSTPTSSQVAARATSGTSPSGAAARSAMHAARPGAAGRDTVSRGAVVQRPLHGTGGSERNDENVAGTIGQKASEGAVSNPCKLVSQAQAQAIVRAPIATPQQAPLGPTCIYQPRGGRQQITLVVEALDFAKIRLKVHDTIRAAVAHRTAYCGRYGRPTTFVPLARGQVLNIAAPCAIGLRFAEVAVRKLDKSL